MDKQEASLYLQYLLGRVQPKQAPYTLQGIIPETAGIRAQTVNDKIRQARDFIGRLIAPVVGLDFDAMAADEAEGVLRQMLVYHGSPHKFEKFDASKIGTGEGNQIFGHGLYFAENPEVATSYKFAGQPGYLNPTVQRIAQEALDATKGDMPAARNILWEKYMSATDPSVRSPLRDAYNNIATFAEKRIGNLYQADLPDEHIAKMLDWDKPLSEETAQKIAASLPVKPVNVGHGMYGVAIVQENGSGRLLSGISGTSPEGAVANVPKFLAATTKGESVYGDLRRWLGSDQAASKHLQSIGIPGIKYLDQSSRKAGAGTRNFVVFDPSILKNIKRK